MAQIGEVWRKAIFYRDKATGEMVPKYLLILGFSRAGDVIYKLLTSRVDHRSTVPACSHDDLRPGYYMGIPQPSGQLLKETWVDLRESEDYDYQDFRQDVRNNVLTPVFQIPQRELCEILECAANAPDTTGYQRDGMMASRAQLGCT